MPVEQQEDWRIGNIAKFSRELYSSLSDINWLDKNIFIKLQYSYLDKLNILIYIFTIYEEVFKYLGLLLEKNVRNLRPSVSFILATGVDFFS